MNRILSDLVGIIGHWIKARIDERRAEREGKRKYCLDDLKRQQELLLEFLGTLKSDFITLHNVGQTWDKEWRREKACAIGKWVERYRPLFPKQVQEAMTGVSNMAGTMVTEEGLNLLQDIEGFKKATNLFRTIEIYLDEIRRKLMSK